MPLALNLELGQATFAAGTGSFTTSAFTPPNNSLLVAIICVDETGGTTDPTTDLTITDSQGLTWTSRVAGGDAVTWTFGQRIYTAPVTTGASMTVTVDCAARDIYMYDVQVVSFTGYNTGSPTGGKVVTTGLAVNGADQITLDASPASGSYVLGCLLANGPDAATPDPGSAFTELRDAFAAAMSVQLQYRTGSTSPIVDWVAVNTVGSDNAKTMGIAIEIKASGAAAPTGVPSPTAQRNYRHTGRH